MTELPRTRLSLLVRLKDPGDSAAWKNFVDVYGPAVFAFARRHGMQPADAADLTQDVCKSVSLALPALAFDPARGKFRGWLFTIVRNQVRMFHRSRARRGLHTGADELLADLPDDSAAESWDLECRRRLFAWACDRVRPTVSEATWTVFWRLAVDEESGEAVARETGMSVAAAYLAKSRVLAKLRTVVAEVEEEEQP